MEQGATYAEIQRATRLSRNTISEIKKGIMQTNTALAAAIKKNEHRSLSSIGVLSRSVISKGLEAVLEGEGDDIPLSQILKALEVAFWQRRTLEGEASIIIDHGALSLSADQRRSRLTELQARLDDLEAKERNTVVVSSHTVEG